ncbi:GNAT family N-acetyltransferase [Reichenbachiella versicolor]|uniref:GNAT family N-acetyltransferase n=1 Tax=Reichenbachiella versicolor TaxID=1821036 RepID=UPI001C878C63|nr:GNAT family N-acetyltransferase [Reichenbachiella versicolor]
MNYIIREVTAKDAEQIAEIYNYYILNSVATFEEELIDPKEIQKRISNILESGHFWFVVEYNGNLIGYSYSSLWKERVSYRFSAAVAVYLDLNFTGKGLGNKLYEALFKKLKEKNIHTVIGGITLPNEGSVALHESFGMKKVAHFSEVGFKFGKWLDVGYWQVIL